MMNYNEALDYIHSVNWTFCKPGLDRISELTKKLGNPEKRLKFIHVAGTNGKGSFSSMMSEILMASGLKVGLYTSPYIVDFNERMRINGANIDNEALARLTERVKPIADAMQDKPTEFELITAIALLYFAEANADIVVLECGMGGRLDSTNIIPSPILSVITGIALDHTAFLGDTIEKIAMEKAGIIKHGSPVIYGGIDGAAESVIREAAAANSSRYARSELSRLEVLSSTLGGTVLNYKSHKGIEIHLLGAYQPRNTALVLEACDMLKSAVPAITEESIRTGLKNARWRARFEIISHDPLVIFDGAHNPEGISSAVESIRSYFGDSKVLILSGVLRDKDYEFIAGELARAAKRVYTITPNSPRALSAGEYRDTIIAHGTDAVAYGDIYSAVKAAVNDAKKESTPLVCLGSLYTYCDVISAMEKV